LTGGRCTTFAGFVGGARRIFAWIDAGCRAIVRCFVTVHLSRVSSCLE
jgi:hypothetical protein